MENINKEDEILNSAIVLFSENGFRDTSVQDIAKYCKVSKATIYKLFSSKEEILIKIINEINKQIFLEIEGIECEIQGNKIERLKKKFSIFLESWYKKREFIAIIYENQSLMKEEKVKKLITTNKTFVINWYKEILIEAFGEKINERVCDVLIILVGIIREFKGINNIYLDKSSYKPDYYKTSEFIVDILAVVVENLDKIGPFVEKDIFESVYGSKVITKEIFFHEWDIKLDKINKSLKRSKNKQERECIENSLEALEEELKKENPRKFLVDSQMMYLKNFEMIKKEIAFLENLYIRSEIYNKLV